MLWLVKMISDDQIVFYGNRVDDIRIQGNVINTLQARMGTGGGNMPMVFEPKSAFEENWAESEVKNALRANASKSSHAVVEQAVAIQGNMIGRADTAGPQGKGYTEEGEPMFTLTKTDIHAVAGSTVRRLTPMECERLQGFPDNWTEGQTDGHRYKQMGNAVTVNVIEWIGFRL
jgi:DNA (cytosine-5)-methyltransferase 1